VILVSDQAETIERRGYAGDARGIARARRSCGSIRASSGTLPTRSRQPNRDEAEAACHRLSAVWILRAGDARIARPP